MTIFKDLRLVSTNRMKRVDSSHVWHRKKKTNAAKAAMAALCKSFPDRVRVKNIAFSISMTADDSPLDRDMWVMNENLETMRVADRDDTTYILRHPVPNSEYVDTNGKCNSTAHQKYGGTGRYLDEIYNTAIEHDNLFKKPWKRKSKNCMGRENVRAENIYHRDDYTNECSDVEYEDCDSSDADECVGNTLGNNIPLGINK
ncbi:hypothetical protein, variant [Sphaeroforma arctica JP610]|nr:hypothetical protein, variant [Sphaeroforma arctica JP610]KNC78252.1 hypothetical protein, variant [Sphaeroforma arctica JP610]|eukprot:XP_014152154.1 hypothetical protein, variant [Sphaeroforma arctica JP610]